MRLFREPLLDGDAGTLQTLHRMRELVHSAFGDPQFIQAAQSLVGDRRGADEKAQFLYYWVQSKVRYVNDPVDMELLRTPQFMLSEIVRRGFTTGDCDDFSILLTALLAAVGVPSRFVAVAKRSAGTFSHVYVEAQVGLDWMALDAIIPQGWPGQTMTAQRRLVLDI